MPKTDVKNFLPVIPFLISCRFIKVQFSQSHASFNTAVITYNFNNIFLLFQFSTCSFVLRLYNGTYIAYYTEKNNVYINLLAPELLFFFNFSTPCI